MPTRRGFLIGAGAGLGVLAAAAAGGDVLAHHFGATEAELVRDPYRVLRNPISHGVTLHTASFHSRYRHADTTWIAAIPPGAKLHDLPMTLALHGRGGNGQSALGNDLMPALAAHVKAGGAPFAVVAVDGGDHAYWHPRADGENPLRMITDELLPRAAALGLRTDRIGVMGWSMGGFGALMMARESAQHRLAATKVLAATASGPALWPSAGLTAAGAFDSPADWERWGNLVVDPGIDGRVALRVDCGDTDPFVPTVRRYIAELHPRPAGGIGHGGHDSAFWSSVMPAQVAFMAKHLSP